MKNRYNKIVNLSIKRCTNESNVLLLRRNCAANRSTHDNTNTDRLNFLLLRRNSVSGNWTLDFWLLRGKQKGQSLTVSEGEREKGDVHPRDECLVIATRGTWCLRARESSRLFRSTVCLYLANWPRSSGWVHYQCIAAHPSIELFDAASKQPTFPPHRSAFISMNTMPRVPTCSDSCQSRSIHLLLSLYYFPLERRFLPFLFGSLRFAIRTIVDRPWDIFYDGSRAFLLFRSNVSTEEPASWTVEVVAAG